MNILSAKSPQLESLDKPKVLVIIPLGSIEAHGAHLPLGTDSIIVEHFAKEVGEEFENVLVAPTVTYSYNLINYGYPGTVSIQPENYAHYLEDIIKSFFHHGFENFLLLSSHGGHEVPTKLAIMNLLREIPEVKISFKTWWKLAKVRSKHAERIETSLMLKIAPELVDMRKAVDCDPKNPWHWYPSRKKYYPDSYGVNGEPSKADEKSAEELYGKVVGGIRSYVVDLLKEIEETVSQ